MEPMPLPAGGNPHDGPAMAPVGLAAYTLSNAFGIGREASRKGLLNAQSALRPGDFPGLEFQTWIGRVEGIESHRLPRSLSDFDGRNNRMMDLTLDQDGFRKAVQEACRRWGRDRIGVVIGTSTSGILESERAYRRRNEAGELPADFRYRERQNTAAPAAFVMESLQLRGPAWSSSSACASAGKAFATGARLLAAGWCDAVVVGGADSLCLTTLYGFHALELVSESPCQPMDRQRRGISIGEAAGFALLVRTADHSGPITLLGVGESADAYHMTRPDPSGEGAALAIRRCFSSAGRTPDEVDFTLLHGTGTRSNDAAEDLALMKTLGPMAPCASIKGAIGHTLGASGIQNALFAALSLESGVYPGTVGLDQVDPDFFAEVRAEVTTGSPNTLLVNAFGFGGSNVALLLGRRR